MAEGDPRPPRVLVCAPVGRDARLIGDLIERGGLACEACADAGALAEAVAAGEGPAIVASEALADPPAVRRLARALSDQPAWSETPLVALLPTSGTLRGHTDALLNRSATTWLRRPVRATALLGVVRASVESRRRQLQVRDLLEREALLRRRLEIRADQLKRVALQATEVEERERERISRLLHDHLQQTLVACRAQLSLLRRAGAGDDGRARRVDELLKEALSQTRSLAVDLTPPVLHDAPFTEALDWLADKMAVDHALRVELAIPAPVGVRPAPIRTLLFDAARELLMNVVKHAQVDWCTLSLHRRDNGALALTVEDEGAGGEEIDVHAARGSGLGLFRMSERVTHIGGAFRVRCAPHQGCRVELTIPASALEDEAATSAGRGGG